jgi:hypothetical protein
MSDKYVDASCEVLNQADRLMDPERKQTFVLESIALALMSIAQSLSDKTIDDPTDITVLKIYSWDTGDWVALEADGKVFYEGHSVPDYVYEGLLRLGGKYDVKKYTVLYDDETSTPMDWLGIKPEHIKELV